MKSKKEKGSGKAASQPELEERVVFVNRCSKVVKGGRRFSFSAVVVVGNRNGKKRFDYYNPPLLRVDSPASLTRWGRANNIHIFLPANGHSFDKPPFR